MRIGLILFFLLSLSSATTFVQAQDFTDTRRKTESFAKLQPAEVRADVAFFSFGGIDESAQAHQLTQYAATLVSTDSLVIQQGGVYAKVKLAPFEAAKHKLTYDESTLIRIDKKPYFGNYGRVPKKEIASILLIVGGDTLTVPPTAYQDLYNLNFQYTDKGVERTGDAVYISKDKKRIYLYLFNQDRTGNYEVTWIFVNNQYYRRVLDYDFL